MLLHFALCDDNTTDTQYLCSLVSGWAEESGHLANIACFASAEEFLFRYAEDKGFDLLLLDIEMPGQNGVELARQLRAQNREIQIIFITGYMDYIESGYDVEAFRYLLKPVARERLFDVLSRAVEKLRRNERTIVLQTEDELVRIPLYEIRYIEVRQNYVTVHADESYTGRMTLAAVESALDESFFRTDRSFLVNLWFVKKVTKSAAILKDGTEVPIARRRYEPLCQTMIHYF